MKLASTLLQAGALALVVGICLQFNSFVTSAVGVAAFFGFSAVILNYLKGF